MRYCAQESLRLNERKGTDARRLGPVMSHVTGKRLHDKRQVDRERTDRRDMDRALGRRR